MVSVSLLTRLLNGALLLDPLVYLLLLSSYFGGGQAAVEVLNRLVEIVAIVSELENV
jgi:hypothetical protein